MATISKLSLSGSFQGKPIQITTTSSVGTTLHTTGTQSTIIDEIWIYATNVDSAQRTLTIEYGATNSGSEISVVIPSKSGLSVILPGVVLTGNDTTGTTVTAYASISNTINIVGYVNRIIP